MAKFEMLLLAMSLISLASSRPQQIDPDVPTPYDFQYKVENPPTNTFFGQSENGDPAGNVAGSYYTVLPDGRLQTVEYFVNGESGYVPRITYQPFSGSI
ncbi:hypothetical protein PPYR_13393 [Photinus pyralis]|uniref:Uncharacterized protein n=1 Tax=Photinus pyralis TaxID=7054 RepID=A0A5N4A8X6_PHOPY|nr:uncharacterized protein LOC116177746 [Photinus pyralis]XP_031352687.1 uncharacterized protein LOC116177746 [Photinus pyralis]XP_031355292.1 uncharacterized protein LOC116179629 [Photinus pyralis]XP_031355293.1 uncharacterized protein LOC116179629 [Photinus pyralis]KAB0793773.1 hypothetical protein PPYR_13393 [Photinus pyralis]